MYERIMLPALPEKPPLAPFRIVPIFLKLKSLKNLFAAPVRKQTSTSRFQAPKFVRQVREMSANCPRTVHQRLAQRQAMAGFRACSLKPGQAFPGIPSGRTEFLQTAFGSAGRHTRDRWHNPGPILRLLFDICSTIPEHFPKRLRQFPNKCRKNAAVKPRLSRTCLPSFPALSGGYPRRERLYRKRTGLRD